MIHKHHEWLADVNKSIMESYEHEQEMARESGRTQETGHIVESRWDDVLTDRLPPQYEIGKRKYLPLETEDGPEVTKGTDLVDAALKERTSVAAAIGRRRPPIMTSYDNLIRLTAASRLW